MTVPQNNQQEEPITTAERMWELVQEIALELPGSSEIYPFAEGWEAAKVRDKWFMISTVLDTRIVNLKATPTDVLALCQEYPSISPGYHMNKKHWITLRPGADLTEEIVRELVIESYRLVVANLPKRYQPVNPETFGQS